MSASPISPADISPTTTSARTPSVKTWAPAAALPKRNAGEAIWRGMLGKCPNCGKGRMFRAFLKVADACEACGEELHHHRADDMPPYITITIVGHLVVTGVLALEKAMAPAPTVQLAIWLPLTLILTLLLIQPVKGAIVGLQWALRMHGFHPDGDRDDVTAEPWRDVLGQPTRD
jgi:uncharacterized protein (DUF983 family)